MQLHCKRPYPLRTRLNNVVLPGVNQSAPGRTGLRERALCSVFRVPDWSGISPGLDLWVYEQVARVIESAITSGEYPPGSLLPSRTG